ncbi:hypothetical protein E2320_006150, partial [Naja naja]
MSFTERGSSKRLACPTTPLGRWQKSAPFAKPTSGCCRRCTRHFGMSFYAYNPLAGMEWEGI